ncbi:MAG: inositol monophosphatase family protein [Elainellaceae cyanobacterium]
MSIVTPVNVQLSYLDFARQLAQAAEAVIMPHFRSHTVSFKSDGSEVTVADKQGEQVMRSLIEQTYPDHDILGEEFGASAQERTSDAGHQYQWILDPIDGTAWFTLGVPLFGTLVALLEQGEPIVGVIHLPGLGETVYAAKGHGCWYQAQGEQPVRVTVRPPVDLTQAIASTTGVHSSDIQCKSGETPYALTQLINSVQKFRFCSDCNQHALVCRGKLHVAVDTLMNPWDVAALVPCIEEAGGKVTTLQGDRHNIVFGGSLLSTCGEPLHSEVLKLLQP